jgi:hypothetical protein
MVAARIGDLPAFINLLFAGGADEMIAHGGGS